MCACTVLYIRYIHADLASTMPSAQPTPGPTSLPLFIGEETDGPTFTPTDNNNTAEEETDDGDDGNDKLSGNDVIQYPSNNLFFCVGLVMMTMMMMVA